MQETFTIELKGLKFFANHGHYQEEALTGNEFEVSVHLLFVPENDGELNLDQTINYEKVYALVRDRMNTQSALLENIARTIADDLQKAFDMLTEINIRIHKLQVPIRGFRGTAGVNYSRRIK